jgi:cytochrome c551
MKRKLTILMVVVIFSIALGACGQPKEPPPPTNTPVPVEIEDDADAESSEDEMAEAETQAIDPAALFSSKCSSCHGADRSGDRGPSLLPDRLTKESTQYAETITNGRDDMPSWKGKLSVDEINALAELILTTPE